MAPGSQKPPKFSTLDAETDPFKIGRIPQPFLWGLYVGHREEYQEFSSVDDLVSVLADLGGTVYAHNGGKFDYHYLRDHINSDEPLLIINGRLAKFRIGRTEFRDSLNLFPNTRLADFDDAYGAKLKIDYAKLEPDARTDPNNAAEISRYLRRDCTRLYEIVAAYFERYGKSLTQASSSMRYFERMYEIQAPRQTQIQYERYKPFYYGGRVQCFAQGVESVRFGVADINSAYPFAMLRDHAFSPEATLERHLPPEPELYRCFIQLDCTSRGAFPWRDPETHELYFPDDEAGHRNRLRRYSVTGWEFLTALRLDTIKNIHIREVHCFPQVMNFARYIEHFFAEREECRKRDDVAGRIFGKYFMNSLYGKFGANCANYHEYVIATTDSVEGWLAKGFIIYKPWGPRFLLARTPQAEQLNDLSSRKWRYYNVATAASVTGFVRAYLFDALNRCSGPLYCDTDSIAARDISALPFGDALGQFKSEGVFDHYAIAGKKLYAFHFADRSREYDPAQTETARTWKIASKGVNFAALSDGPARIEAIALGGRIDYEPEVPTYSITRNAPRFIPRTITKTAKDIAIAPEMDL